MSSMWTPRHSSEAGQSAKAGFRAYRAADCHRRRANGRVRSESRAGEMGFAVQQVQAGADHRF